MTLQDAANLAVVMTVINQLEYARTGRKLSAFEQNVLDTLRRSVEGWLK